MAISYSTPAEALKRSSLVRLPPESSSLAWTTGLLTMLPLYTPSKVSKVLPRVLKVATPLAGATHRYQTDLPPGFCAGFGSPDSLLAEELVPETIPLTPEIWTRLVKKSAVGAVGT